MTNEETNKTVENEWLVDKERIEELGKEQEKIDNTIEKWAKGLNMTYNAVGVLGFGAVVALVIKESIKK